MSSMTGNKLKLSVFGESHGEAIGCVIDGLPGGIKLDFDKIDSEMKRRAPGNDKTSTARKEPDSPKIISGLLNGVTTGAPLAMLIENTNAKSGDYGDVKRIFRPSHSDYPAFVKYGGFNDVSGGGHFSGRLTAPIVFAGAVAKQILSEKGVEIGAHIKRIGEAYDSCFDLNGIDAALLNRLSKTSFSVIDENAEEAMRAEVEKCRLDKDSIGGEIECAVIGLPAGIGGNMFDTVESRLSSMLFAIPAVKGVQFGLGFGFTGERASRVNDEYEIKNGAVSLKSNNNGGILGGITNGAPIVFSVAVKPTPSISKPQNSVNIEKMENEIIEIKGRHDPCIVPRAVSVVEAAAALVILDILL